jgi:thermitase
MWDFVSNDNDPSEVGQLRVNPSFGHGTHVAGIVSLVVPDARIMPLRILDENGEGELWRITAALIWAANHGADVANLSLGYPQNVELLKQLIDCSAFGTTPTGTQFPINNPGRMGITVSSGNGGNSTPIFPAAEDSHALPVAASTANDRLALFSTYHRDWVEASAPGENIVSALPGGRYGVWSGTSMAAPIAAGVTALVKAKYPTMFPTGHDLTDHVAETSVDIRYTHPNWTTQVRLHRVDALCAVTIFDPQVCPIPQNVTAASGFEEFLLKQ